MGILGHKYELFIIAAPGIFIGMEINAIRLGRYILIEILLPRAFQLVLSLYIHFRNGWGF